MIYLNRIFKQFMALSLRERLLSIAGIAAVVYFLFDLTLVQPQQRQTKALREKISQQESELSAFAKAMQALSDGGTADPLALQRAERDELRNKFAQAESVIGRATAEVRLGEVIRSMIAAKPGLTLVSLKTLPVETFFKPAAVPAAPASSVVPVSSIVLPTLYKHGIDVTVRGSYVTLIPYLQELERNSNLFWGNVRIDVATHPDATLKLTIFTLSARPELPLG